MIDIEEFEQLKLELLSGMEEYQKNVQDTAFEHLSDWESQVERISVFTKFITANAKYRHFIHSYVKWITKHEDDL